MQVLATDLDNFRVVAEKNLVPKARYLSAAMRDVEQARLWKRVWLWACLLEDLPDHGSYYEYEVGDQSVLILRDYDGELRAFHNVCPHRGNRLRSGQGKAQEVLACPYHKWSWKLNGELHEVPDRETFPPFEDSSFSLRPVRLEPWQQFVFINLDENAEPLSQYLQPLAERLAPYHWEHHTRTRSVTLPLAANWKTIVDGFLDVYHLQGVHPQLLRQMDDVNTTYEIMGHHSAMYMPMGVASPRLPDHSDRVVIDELSKPGSGILGKMLGLYEQYTTDESGRGQLPDGVSVRDALLEVGRAEAERRGLDFSGLSDEQVVDDHHYFFFPNVVCNVYAGHFIVARVRPDADDHERCFFDMFIFNWLGEESGNEASASARASAHQQVPEHTEVGRVPDQDFSALPRVQLGMHSDGIEHIFLSEQEIRVKHFHEVIDHYLFED